MEQSLATRFTRVASRFGSGLKTAFKSLVLGASLGLINRLLNPINELDQKIKGLLHQGADLTELSQRFGTTPGQLKQVEAIAGSFKITPEKFREMLEKYADSVEKAREELGNPLEQKSAATLILGPLAEKKDILQSFLGFLKKLKEVGAGEGSLQPLTPRATKMLANAAANKVPLTEAQKKDLISTGEARFRTGAESQGILEKEVLGSQQYGGFNKLINANIPRVAKNLNVSDVPLLNEKIARLDQLDTQSKILQIQNEQNDFIKASSNINETIIRDLEARRAKDDSETTDRIGSYENIAKTANLLDEVSASLFEISNTVVSGFRQLAEMGGDIREIRKSGFWRSVFKGGSK
jgi:hypothetical protein